MEGIFDRIGFLIEDPIDLKGPPKVVGFGSGSIEGWVLRSVSFPTDLLSVLS